MAACSPACLPVCLPALPACRGGDAAGEAEDCGARLPANKDRWVNAGRGSLAEAFCPVCCVRTLIPGSMGDNGLRNQTHTLLPSLRANLHLCHSPFLPPSLPPCLLPLPADFLFERRLNDYIYQVVADFSSGKPALVFCSSRKGTSEAAAHLVREAARQGGAGPWGAFVRDAGQRQRLAQAAAGLKDSQLRECIKAGVGFHHAAMEPEERAAVEVLFIAQDLPVGARLCAVGVGMPACLPARPTTCPSAAAPACPRPPARPAGAVHHQHAGHGRQPARPPGGHQGHAALHRQRGRGGLGLPGVRAQHLPAGGWAAGVVVGGWVGGWVGGHAHMQAGWYSSPRGRVQHWCTQ